MRKCMKVGKKIKCYLHDPILDFHVKHFVISDLCWHRRREVFMLTQEVGEAGKNRLRGEGQAVPGFFQGMLNS